MKLQFKHQSFQTDAVNAVADLFSGQENSRSTFSIMRNERQFSFLQNEYGIGNALAIDDTAMFANMLAVQKRNNLPRTADLQGKQFCVEMETGTGKTYVYTKTIFELNKRYGFTKFIILEDGDKGEYAHMFEECYAELLNQSKYAPLKERFSMPVAKAHDGYFSQDKKGNYKNTNGDTLDDYSTYNTIMKDKEWLLSFDCPLRFIFSHSALKEGWDNPNVFQVCTLIEQKSTFTCRQKIGRGLRLCVNQDGERIEDPNINILHVMANESFAEFADTLQKEIEQESGMKFGVLDIGLFSGMVYTEDVREEKIIVPAEAHSLVAHLERKGYITSQGAALPAMRTAIEKDTLDVPPELE